MKREFESLSLLAAQALMREVLDAGKRFRFTAHGTSMSPFIRDGDRVEMDLPDKPRYGDVLAVSNGQRLLVHRVIDLKGNAVLLKGDHARDPDGWFQPEEIIGKICAVWHRNQLQPIGVNRLCRTIAVLSRLGILPVFLRIYGKCRKKFQKSA